MDPSCQMPNKKKRQAFLKFTTHGSPLTYTWIQKKNILLNLTLISPNPDQSKVKQHCSARTLTTPFSQITDILSSTPVNEKKNVHKLFYNNTIYINFLMMIMHKLTYMTHKLSSCSSFKPFDLVFFSLVILQM